MIPLIAGGWALGVWAVHSPVFSLRSVTFEGVHRVKLSDFQDTLSVQKGKNLLTLSLRAFRERLETHPWVRRARLYRYFPDSIHVVVEEYHPLVLVSLHDAWFWLDETGGNFIPAESSEWRDGFAAPLLTGLAAGTPMGERHAVSHALLELRRKAPSFFRRAAAFDVSDSSRLTVRLRDRSELLYLNPKDPTRNLKHLNALWKELALRHESPQAGEVVDLRWKGQIVRSMEKVSTLAKVSDENLQNMELFFLPEGAARGVIPLMQAVLSGPFHREDMRHG